MGDGIDLSEALNSLGSSKNLDKNKVRESIGALFYWKRSCWKSFEGTQGARYWGDDVKEISLRRHFLTQVLAHFDGIINSVNEGEIYEAKYAEDGMEWSGNQLSYVYEYPTVMCGGDASAPQKREGNSLFQPLVMSDNIKVEDADPSGNKAIVLENETLATVEDVLNDAIWCLESVASLLEKNCALAIPAVAKFLLMRLDLSAANIYSRASFYEVQGGKNSEHIERIVGQLKDEALIASQLILYFPLDSIMYSPLICSDFNKNIDTGKFCIRIKALLLASQTPCLILSTARLIAACTSPVKEPNAERYLVDTAGLVHGTVHEPIGEKENASSEIQRTLYREQVKVLGLMINELRFVCGLNLLEFNCGSSNEFLNVDNRLVLSIVWNIIPKELKWKPRIDTSMLDKAESEAEDCGSFGFNGMSMSALFRFLYFGSLRRVCINLVPEEILGYFLTLNGNGGYECLRKALCQILSYIVVLLNSFSSKFKASPFCFETFGVAAAGSDPTIERQAKELLKDIQGAYPFLFTEERISSHFQGAFVRSATLMVSKVLTIMKIPTVLHTITEGQASRCILSFEAAEETASHQIQDKSLFSFRHPYTGRVHFPNGLPYEIIQSFGASSIQCYRNERSTGFLSYIREERSLRMCMLMARVLRAVMLLVTGQTETLQALVLPCVLRLLDVPQPEVRLMTLLCLSEIMQQNLGMGEQRRLTSFVIPTYQALSNCFPIFNELSICFEAYLKAFVSTSRAFCRSGFENLFFDSIVSLMNLCHVALIGNNDRLEVFLRETRPLVQHEKDAICLSFHDWLKNCISGILCSSYNAQIEGVLTIELLMDYNVHPSYGIDVLVALLTASLLPNHTAFSHLGRGYTVLAKVRRLIGNEQYCAILTEFRQRLENGSCPFSIGASSTRIEESE